MTMMSTYTGAVKLCLLKMKKKDDSEINFGIARNWHTSRWTGTKKKL